MMTKNFWIGMTAALMASTAIAPVAVQAQDGTMTAGRSYQGELGSGDASDGDKQYYDEWSVRGSAGERLSITMASDAFDTQLRATLPDGTVLSNDDDPWTAEDTDSRIDFTMPSDGEVRVRASSYRAQGTGDYTIRVVPSEQLQVAQGGEAPSRTIAIGQQLTANFDGEATLGRNGHHAQRYVFSGRAGQRVDIRAGSTDFDTRIALSNGEDFSVANDDDATASDATLNSRILATLPADGEYSLLVTSYSPGETGSYEVSVLPNRSGVADTEVQGAGATRIALGNAFNEALGKNDDALASGEFVDRYTFQGRRGQPVTVDYSSEDFDTYLIVRSPSGVQVDIDDTGESLNSRYETVLEEDGLYTVLATSYAPGAGGYYRLALEEGTTRIPANAQQRRVFAISVGVADYGGNTSNLTDTDTDASKLFTRLEELGVLHPASILLTNQEATLPEFRRAFAEVARQAGPDDVFLFFFSGHGTQEDDPTDTAELDGRDEQLVFGDGEELLDDELAQMFGQVRAGTSMVVLDACFSGGFERDVITRPNMMGLFSSEEDLTSLVASEFSAGGYLARFFSDGIGGRADDNDDGNVTAGELVSYLRYRFREQCEGRNCIEAETGDAQRNHQELVVQRGSIEVDDIVMTLPRQYGLLRTSR